MRDKFHESRVAVAGGHFAQSNLRASTALEAAPRPY
jgi:hypothetical protein